MLFTTKHSQTSLKSTLLFSTRCSSDVSEPDTRVASTSAWVRVLIQVLGRSLWESVCGSDHNLTVLVQLVYRQCQITSMSVPLRRFESWGNNFFFLLFWHFSGEILGKAASKLIFRRKPVMILSYRNQTLSAYGLRKIAAYKIPDPKCFRNT